VIVEQDVLQLQVAMADRIRMKVVQCIEQLTHDPHRINNGKGAAIHEILEQFPMGRILEHEIDVLL
jgi:hypothetical protein